MSEEEPADKERLNPFLMLIGAASVYGTYAIDTLLLHSTDFVTSLEIGMSLIALGLAAKAIAQEFLLPRKTEVENRQEVPGVVSLASGAGPAMLGALIQVYVGSLDSPLHFLAPAAPLIHIGVTSGLLYHTIRQDMNHDQIGKK